MNKNLRKSWIEVFKEKVKWSVQKSFFLKLIEFLFGRIQRKKWKARHACQLIPPSQKKKERKSNEWETKTKKKQNEAG